MAVRPCFCTYVLVIVIGAKVSSNARSVGYHSEWDPGVTSNALKTIKELPTSSSSISVTRPMMRLIVSSSPSIEV
jgi:hypothetical protein